MISVGFQGKPFNITVIQVYALTSNAEEAEVEWLYEDLQDLLELTPEGDVLFITGDWNAKVGSQETPGVTGKFGLGVQNEAKAKANRVLPREHTGHRESSGSKGNTMCPITSQKPSLWHPSWLSDACPTRKDSKSE